MIDISDEVQHNPTNHCFLPISFLFLQGHSLAILTLAPCVPSVGSHVRHTSHRCSSQTGPTITPLTHPRRLHFISCNSTVSPRPPSSTLPSDALPRCQRGEGGERIIWVTRGRAFQVATPATILPQKQSINKREFIRGPLLFPSACRPDGATGGQLNTSRAGESVYKSSVHPTSWTSHPFRSGGGAHTLASSPGSPPERDGHRVFGFLRLRLSTKE